jgi:hypothetical protein
VLPLSSHHASRERGSNRGFPGFPTSARSPIGLFLFVGIAARARRGRRAGVTVASQVYRLDTARKTLTYLNTKPMADLGYYDEVSDLETWLASCRHQLFARKIL